MLILDFDFSLTFGAPELVLLTDRASVGIHYSTNQTVLWTGGYADRGDRPKAKELIAILCIRCVACLSTHVAHVECDTTDFAMTDTYLLE